MNKLLGKPVKSPVFPLNLRKLFQKPKFWNSLEYKNVLSGYRSIVPGDKTPVPGNTAAPPGRKSRGEEFG
jgi:hypothetical protein